MGKRTLLFGVAMLLVGSLLIRPALAREYPSRPIEINVGYSAGSTFDLVARVIADLAPKYLKQSMIVVNKVGAGGSIAAADIISSNPDGYKVALLTTGFFATTIKTQKVPFGQDDLTPIVNFTEQKLGLLVKGDSPWKTLNDLLDYARKNPRNLRWSHVGRGIITHINGLLMFRKAGVETTDVPYKGTPEQITALLGGHVDASGVTLGILKDNIKVGKIRPLVFFNERRYSDFRDVPCSLELGFPEASKLMVQVGFYVHKNTPDDIKKTLFDASKQIYDDPEFKKRIDELGDEPKFATPEVMKETIRRDIEISVPILKEFGLYTGK